MALKMTVTHKDIIVKDTYVKVRYISGTKDEVDIRISFRASKNSPQLYEERYLMPLDLNGPNPFKQAYIHLKTLEKFSSAVDDI